MTAAAAAAADATENHAERRPAAIDLGAPIGAAQALQPDPPVDVAPFARVVDDGPGGG